MFTQFQANMIKDCGSEVGFQVYEVFFNRNIKSIFILNNLGLIKGLQTVGLLSGDYCAHIKIYIFSSYKESRSKQC